MYFLAENMFFERNIPLAEKGGVSHEKPHQVNIFSRASRAICCHSFRVKNVILQLFSQFFCILFSERNFLFAKENISFAKEMLFCNSC